MLRVFPRHSPKQLILSALLLLATCRFSFVFLAQFALKLFNIHIIGNYVFCDHCNKRVAKKTFHEHRRLGQVKNTSWQTNLSKKPFVTGHSTTQSDSGDGMQLVVAGLDDENYMYSSDDQEEQERSALFDEEDQVFFSDTDEADSAAICSNDYVNNDEVSGTTAFAIVIFTCIPNMNT